MDEYSKYIEIAKRELLKPIFEVTKQYLEVHNVQLEVARVKVVFDIISIYFKVENERFFLVVNVEKTDNPKPVWIWIESGHTINLTATSEQLSFQELSAFLHLTPLKGWSKGELMKNGKSEYSFSRIIYDSNKNEAYGLNEKLSEFLTEIEKDKEGIAKLVENANVCISVCLYQYVSGNAGIHFDIDTINRLQKLKLPLDIDTYIVGNELIAKE